MGLGVCDYERSAAINVHPSVTFLIQGASDTICYSASQRPKESSSTGGRFFFFFFPTGGRF